MTGPTAALATVEGERITVHEPVVDPVRKLKPLLLPELLRMEIRPRAQLLSPVLPEKGLAMVYAPRGVGKTHLSLLMAYAVASGGTALRWKASAPRRVLCIDGEMPMVTLQERLASIVAAAPEEAPADHFQILAADYFDNGLPNLATREGQAAIDPLLAGISLVVVDNISTLASAGRDNDAESWTPVQEWLLRLRRRGLSVLLVHHAGKAGQQRGTSRREDVLDTVISLRRPDDYRPSEGARFEVHLDKARGVHGEAAMPFEARLEIREGEAVWSTREIVDAKLEQVAALVADGLSVRDISQEMGISKSTVQRLRERAAGMGRRDPGAPR